MSFLLVTAGFFVAFGLAWQLCRAQGRWRVLDHPNERSLHVRPVPRTGGIAIVAGIIVNLCAAALVSESGAQILLLLVAWLPLVLVAWRDDIGGVVVSVRLLVQMVAGVVLLGAGWYGGLFSPVEAGPVMASVRAVLALLFVIWMVNLYNFMDGMDGLAGGMAVIGFGWLSLLGWLAMEPLFTWLAAAVAVSAAGFLVFNFPPARIFMGDTGSYTLGFLAAAFSLWGVAGGLFVISVPVLVFSPFIVDATVTLARRLWRRERVWEAHREHYYQRLAGIGWRHRRVVVLEYVLMLAAGFSAVWLDFLSPALQMAVVAGWAGLYAVLLRLVDRAVSAHRNTDFR